MSRIALAGLVAGVTLLSAGPSHANSLLGGPFDTAPWCLFADIGNGVVREMCTWPSIEACLRERPLWGSTAFCNRNPHFAGYDQRPDRPYRKHRKARR